MAFSLSRKPEPQTLAIRSGRNALGADPPVHHAQVVPVVHHPDPRDRPPVDVEDVDIVPLRGVPGGRLPPRRGRRAVPPLRAAQPPPGRGAVHRQRLPRDLHGPAGRRPRPAQEEPGRVRRVPGQEVQLRQLRDQPQPVGDVPRLGHGEEEGGLRARPGGRPPGRPGRREAGRQPDVLGRAHRRFRLPARAPQPVRGGRVERRLGLRGAPLHADAPQGHEGGHRQVEGVARERRWGGELGERRARRGEVQGRGGAQAL
ncbi:hypothetical protein THAOC_31676 [Thalassiosira oceanica]|uniref:Uncharacterized protein n=1 Tax=Thalassiosira oceanica TaxID=159749 RepID=K0RAU7_THAOC|nr:hypothetical protein THAOC_31676 [Thalassiosira oceanica]|eukprot:EJK49449.1 hypothetical protein THAOC_31676 [Thalassiosira oceanica]